MLAVTRPTSTFQKPPKRVTHLTAIFTSLRLLTRSGPVFGRIPQIVLIYWLHLARSVPSNTRRVPRRLSITIPVVLRRILYIPRIHTAVTIVTSDTTSRILHTRIATGHVKNVKKSCEKWLD